MNKIEELRKKLIASAKKEVKEKYSETDIHIIKSVNILEDIDSTGNLLTEQVKEWYGAHFPELEQFVTENEEYLNLIYHLGERKAFSIAKVKEFVPDEEKARAIVQKASASMGAELREEDIKQLKMLALNCLNLKQERQYLEKYLEENMAKELPNFSQIAGAVIGAKILSKIGSKKRLAFLPASTIQIVGAEKALFLHFKKGIKGPKYGYLYQHPLVKAAKGEHKGKLARSIAAKLSIAVKEDYFGKANIAPKLMKSLEQRAKELQNRKSTEKPQEEKKAQENTEYRKSYPDRRPDSRNNYDRSRNENRGGYDRPFKRDDFRGRDDRPRRPFGSRNSTEPEKRDYRKPSDGRSRYESKSGFGKPFRSGARRQDDKPFKPQGRKFPTDNKRESPSGKKEYKKYGENTKRFEKPFKKDNYQKSEDSAPTPRENRVKTNFLSSSIKPEPRKQEDSHFKSKSKFGKQGFKSKDKKFKK